MKQESLFLLNSATADRSSLFKVSVARVSTVRSGRAAASVAVRTVISVRMTTALTAGKMPDILCLNENLPVRRMEAKGMLEDLWPYIDADPDLGRDTLMLRPLEAMRGGEDRDFSLPVRAEGAGDRR